MCLPSCFSLVAIILVGGIIGRFILRPFRNDPCWMDTVCDSTLSYPFSSVTALRGKLVARKNRKIKKTQRTIGLVKAYFTEVIMVHVT